MEDEAWHQAAADTTRPSMRAMCMIMELIALRAGINMLELADDLDILSVRLDEIPERKPDAVFMLNVSHGFRRRAEARANSADKRENPKTTPALRLVIDNDDGRP